jgi:hypothetical protein
LKRALFGLFGIAILGILVFLAAVLTEIIVAEGYEVSTGNMLVYIKGPIVYGMGVMLLIMLSGKLVWQQRNANAQEIYDTLPLTSGQQFLSSLLSLLGLVLILQTGLFLVGIVLQLNSDGSLELANYLQAIYLYQFRDFALMAMVCLSCHILINQQYLGYAVALLVFLSSQHPALFGIENPLLIFNSAGEITETERNTGVQDVSKYVGYSLYWLGWSLLLSGLAIKYRPMGNENKVLQAFRAAFAKNMR